MRPYYYARRAALRALPDTRLFYFSTSCLFCLIAAGGFLPHKILRCYASCAFAATLLLADDADIATMVLRCITLSLMLREGTLDIIHAASHDITMILR